MRTLPGTGQTSASAHEQWVLRFRTQDASWVSIGSQPRPRTEMRLGARTRTTNRERISRPSGPRKAARWPLLLGSEILGVARERDTRARW